MSVSSKKSWREAAAGSRPSSISTGSQSSTEVEDLKKQLASLRTHYNVMNDAKDDVIAGLQKVNAVLSAQVADTHHKASVDDLSSDSSGSYSDKSKALSAQHEKHKLLFDRVFGYRCIKYPPPGPRNKEFTLLRSSFQLSYHEWEISNIHITTYNKNERISFGIPMKTYTRSDQSSTPRSFIQKYHLNMNGKRPKYLSGWDDTGEYEIVNFET